MSLTSATRDFTVSRVIDAPLAEVWKAWADGARIREWWGPLGFTANVHRMAFREGGSTLVSMSAPAFGEIFTTWSYTRIVPNARIEFESRFANAAGEQIEPIAPGVPDVVPHVVTFRDLGDGRTELSVTEYGYTTEDAMQLSKGGQEQVLDKLVASTQRGFLAPVAGSRDQE